MKRTLLLHFVLLLSTLVCSLGQGPETQNAEVPRRATLTGRVLNAASGEPVKKAHLALSKAESAAALTQTTAPHRNLPPPAMRRATSSSNTLNPAAIVWRRSAMDLSAPNTERRAPT